MDVEYYTSTGGFLFNLGGQFQITKGNRISLKNLKKIVQERLSEDSPLRRVIMVEKDTITRKEFIDKLPIWMELLTMET